MHIFFTRSKTPGSWLIRRVTGEDVSHCAACVGKTVIHSTFEGLKIVSLEEFRALNEIVYSVHLPFTPIRVDLPQSSKYDFGAFFYLGLRLLFPFLPKKNLWQMTGMYLCTEFVSYLVSGKERSELTPKQLYHLLKKDPRNV